MAEQMEVDEAAPTSEQRPEVVVMDEDEDDEAACADLADFLEDAQSKLDDGRNDEVIAILSALLQDPQNRFGPTATSIKERAVYSLCKAYCKAGQYTQVVELLTGDVCRSFFANVTKAKCAKVVRAVLDMVCQLAPDEFEMQAQICRNIISWCRAEKRSFLRQRVEAKLAFVLFQQLQYGDALSMVNDLLAELKKLDDKQLLVETHLVESRIHHGLRNVAKAKAALTASRTAANAIYVAPSLQASIDGMSGILHCEEADYDTAHSYFLESFEQLDQLADSSSNASGTSDKNEFRERAVPCLKYMMLCKILDSLGKALSLSAKGGVGSSTKKVDIGLMLSGRQAVKYAGRDIEAMSAIAQAASKRSLKEFEETTNKYLAELHTDLLIKHHLGVLKEQILESNLIRIVEPYSCVEIEHIASLIEMPLATVERKLSQMILDGKFKGILDQGKGQLIVYEEEGGDLTMEKGLQVIGNMDNVVSSLFQRSQALRTMMI